MVYTKIQVLRVGFHLQDISIFSSFFEDFMQTIHFSVVDPPVNKSLLELGSSVHRRPFTRIVSMDDPWSGDKFVAPLGFCIPKCLWPEGECTHSLEGTTTTLLFDIPGHNQHVMMPQWVHMLAV